MSWRDICVDLKILPHGRDLDLPSYATLHSAGMDLRAAISESRVLKPSERILIPTGIAIALPVGYEAQVRPRSGLALKYGITVLNSPGTVDSDYRGEIKVLLIHLGHNNFIIERGMRIAQIVIQKFEKWTWNVVEELDDTDRSIGGYGSTGEK